MLQSIIKGLAVFILFQASIHAEPAGFNVLACLLLLAAVDAGTGAEPKGDWSAQIMLWVGRFFSLSVVPFYLVTLCTALVLPAQQKTLDPSKAVQVPVRKAPVPAAQQAASPPSRIIAPGGRPPGQRPQLQSGALPRPGSPRRPLTSRPGGPAPGSPVKPATPATPQVSRPAPAATPAPASN